jgi:hypothetical protein
MMRTARWFLSLGRDEERICYVYIFYCGAFGWGRLDAVGCYVLSIFLYIDELRRMVSIDTYICLYLYCEVIRFSKLGRGGGSKNKSFFTYCNNHKAADIV